MVDVVSGTEERACKENIESWNRSFSVLFKLPALSEVELFVFKDKCPPLLLLSLAQVTFRCVVKPACSLFDLSCWYCCGYLVSALSVHLMVRPKLNVSKHFLRRDNTKLAIGTIRRALSLTFTYNRPSIQSKDSYLTGTR